MDQYIDIKLLPDPEFVETVLLNATYAKLHRVLMRVGQGELGVSFPNFDKTLGSILRVHGSQTNLKKLLTNPWLKGLGDYTEVSAISNVPEIVKYRTVCRRQLKSAHNIRRRSVSKGWLTESEALEKYPDCDENRLDLPYIQLKSLSRNTVMRLFIEHGSLVEEPKAGSFSSYGFSRISTIPWF